MAHVARFVTAVVAGPAVLTCHGTGSRECRCLCVLPWYVLHGFWGAFFLCPHVRTCVHPCVAVGRPGREYGEHPTDCGRNVGLQQRNTCQQPRRRCRIRIRPKRVFPMSVHAILCVCGDVRATHIGTLTGTLCAYSLPFMPLAPHLGQGNEDTLVPAH